MAGAVFCVYYKVDAAQHAALAPRVRAFQDGVLARWPGLAAELLQRPQAAGATETWMETYRHADGLTPDMVASIERDAAAAGLTLPRHAETFIPLR